MTDSPTRPGLHLAVVSALVLFLELTLIRWLPAHVMYLTFFTNTVLLASFVGMSIGCLTAGRPTRHILRTPLWLAVTVLVALLLHSFSEEIVHRLDVAGQANPDVVYFGTEAGANQTIEFKVPIEIFMALFFALSAVCLVGPGQEMGRAFSRVPSRTAAYSANLLGSLAGIAAFAACSYLQLSPVVWFAVDAIGVAYLLRPHFAGQAASARLMPYGFLALAVAASLRTSGEVRFLPTDPIINWSPYYRVDFRPDTGQVSTNQIAHQQIESRETRSVETYVLPHIFRRDVKKADGTPAWPEFKRVLIIGSGTGNDLSRACQWCPPDARIDAVEIDPVIQKLGKAHHMDKPYQDPRIHAVLNDGRNFLRRAPEKEYDLVIFALVDSLVNHSGYSSLRMESFLFTADSFQDVRRVLKPTGVGCVYNFFRQGWIAVRLRDEMKAAFGGDPVILTDPPSDAIHIDQFNSGQFTVFFMGSPDVVDPMREAFKKANNSYWLPGDRPVWPETPAHFQANQPEPLPTSDAKKGLYERDRPAWVKLRMAAVEDAPADLRPATDDWPFLYNRRPGIPGLTWRGVGLVTLLSGLLWLVFVGPSKIAATAATSETGLMVRSFLLGAGFMLVETKAVVHMALLFGSTWMVNTFVFAAVLMMSLAGNLFAGWVKPRNLMPYYIGLIASLAMNVLVPLDAFLGMELLPQILLSCLLAFLPVAFAGVIFAASFAQAKNPDRVFGANVAGALVGGLTENLSMLLGFRYLLLVAVGYYLLSSLCRVGKGPAQEQQNHTA
jgi:SAM-dependent methyltransferase